MRFVIAFVGTALCAACSTISPPACPAPDELTQADLIGTWHATIEGLPDATVRLDKHPDFAETVRGHLDRNGARIELAGDIDGGDFTLEESANGRNISATWLGEAVEGSCGREIRGSWKAEGTPIERPFVLRRKP